MRLLRHETRTSARHLNYVYAELVWFGWIGIPGRHKVVGCKASNSAWVVRVAKCRLVGGLRSVWVVIPSWQRYVGFRI